MDIKPGKLAKNALRWVCISALVFIFIELAYTFGFADHYVVSVWPAAGVFYWAVRRYGWSAFIPVFIGNALHNVFAGIPPFFMIANAANALAPIPAIYLEKKLNPSLKIFSNYKGITTFLLPGLGLFSLIAAASGSFTVMAYFSSPIQSFLPMAWRWFLSDYTGALVIGPILIMGPELISSLSKDALNFRPLIYSTAIILLVYLFHLSGLSEQYGHYPTILVSTPVFLWLAFSDSPPRLTVYYFLLSFALLLITIKTIGNLNDSGWLAVQLYMTMIILSGYILHAVVLERRFFLSELQNEKLLLESRVKNRTKKLLQAQQKAEAANRAKSVFLANITHDLRTPLNGIHGMMQLLQETELNKQQKEYVSLSMNSCMFLSNLLGDILDLSKIESDKFTLLNERFDFFDFFHSVVEIFKENTRQKKLQLIREVDTSIPRFLIGDSLRTRQIMFNLIGNAIKFTESGSITVSAHIKERLSDTRVEILFSVIDTGIGIQSKNLSTIFEPFVQENRKPELEHDGVGLGLSIVKRLIDLLGGSILIDSQPEKGTAIYITLPFDVALQTAPETGNTPNTSFDGLTLLLVEDDPINRYASRMILQGLGIVIDSAENGEEALELVVQKKYDCILMDIQLPFINGKEVTEKIRNDKKYSLNIDTPIVALTAYALQNSTESILSSGFNDYIPKPMTKAALISH